MVVQSCAGHCKVIGLTLCYLSCLGGFDLGFDFKKDFDLGFDLVSNFYKVDIRTGG
jgi:hypothetical protein